MDEHFALAPYLSLSPVNSKIDHIAHTHTHTHIIFFFF